MRFLILLGAVFLSAGCADLFRSEPLRILTLNEFDQAENLCAAALPLQVLVDLPEGYSGLESDRIALLLENREVRYLEGYKWDTPVPLLVRGALVNALNSGGCFAGAARAGDNLSSPFRLRAGIRRMHFEQSGVEPPSAAVISMDLSLRDFSRQGGGIARSLFTVREEGDLSSPYALGEAMQKALGRSMREAVLWCRSAMESYRP
ncbi:MAG: ABC-type transport auxiliary lipoprotein family protein [Desulfovibrionaceae bacterium]|nr:ABC-type transport auxiliary lipoprotein family protein [Desulfovibrionaceae bacterium]